MSDPLTLSVFDVSASALTAERTRLAVIAQNIANAQVAKGKDGQPYRRQGVDFETVLAGAKGRAKDGLPAGAVRAKVVQRPGEFRRIKDEGNPEADKDGWVTLPNVNVVDEMVEMIDASRTYEANLSALRTWKQMLTRTIEMAR